MADYADAASLDPEQFVAKYSDGYVDGASDDDDEDDVEEALAAHAGPVDSGSADWKQIITSMNAPSKLKLSGAYLREAQDQKHRMGDLLEGCFSVYKQKNPGDPTGANFYTWLDAMPDYDRVLMVSNVPSSGGHSAALMRGGTGDRNIKPSMVKAFMKGVAYLDKAGRKSYRVTFKAGTAFMKEKDADVELSTAEMSTVFSGKGFGIWVISDKGKLYVGNHIKGMVHHSSFLAGAEVMCGGEMWARNGKILFLSAKSGHYHPGRDNMDWALRVFETCVSNFDEIKVLMWKKSDRKLCMVSPMTFFSSYDWDVWGAISKYEMPRLKAGNFASFPTG